MDDILKLGEGCRLEREQMCRHCGGLIAVRNPTGKCDHLYWPDLLTDEAKRANGFRLVTRQVWESNTGKDSEV